MRAAAVATTHPMSSHTPLRSAAASAARFSTGGAASASVCDTRRVGSGNVGADGKVAVGSCVDDCGESAVRGWVVSSAAIDSPTGRAPPPCIPKSVRESRLPPPTSHFPTGGR